MKDCNRQILAIAWPAIVSNITTPLLGLVDVSIVGHIGALQLGAIAVGGAMMNMVYWLFNFLRMGTSGITAQACGAADGDAARFTLVQSLAIAVAVGALLILGSAPLGHFVLRFMDAGADTTELARLYFGVVICGAPAVLGTYALTGWFLGMQDSRTPMWMAVVTNVCNIAVSLLLVFVFHLEIEGVAAGTLIAQWVGFAAGMVILRRKYGLGLSMLAAGRQALSDIRKLGRFFRVNADIFLRTLCLVAVTMWFTHAGAVQGVEVLGANALLMQLFLFFSFFMDGFAFAAEALAGKHFGAGDIVALRRVVRALCVWGLVLAVVFSAAYLAGGGWILRLLTDDAAVLAVAVEFIPWAAVVPFAGVAAFIFDGVFIGLTRTRGMLLSMAVAMAVFFTLYYLLRTGLGNDGLWTAFVAYLAVRGVVEIALYRMR